MGDQTHIVELIDQVLNETQDQPQLQEKILDLRDALFQIAEKSTLDPVAVLVREAHLSNSSDFVQFYPLVNPLDKEEEAGSLLNEEIEGHGEAEEPSAPPVPGGGGMASCYPTCASQGFPAYSFSLQHE